MVNEYGRNEYNFLNLVQVACGTLKYLFGGYKLVFIILWVKEDTMSRAGQYSDVYHRFVLHFIYYYLFIFLSFSPNNISVKILLL